MNVDDLKEFLEALDVADGLVGNAVKLHRQLIDPLKHVVGCRLEGIP
jgi:hypothetical protein